MFTLTGRGQGQTNSDFHEIYILNT